MSDNQIETVRWSGTPTDNIPSDAAARITALLSSGYTFAAAYAVQHPSYNQFVHFYLFARLPQPSGPVAIGDPDKLEKLAELAGGKTSQDQKNKGAKR